MTSGTDLPTTSWAVLGMLSHADELSGYDLKKWADWSLQFFYWSPSFSQIYAELKRLEKHGYVTSRTVTSEDGVRGKRMYAITTSGRDAVAHWVNHSPVEAPVLKHSVLLRAWLGHLAEPERLREILTAHIDYAEKMRRRAAADAEGSDANPDWAFPSAVLRWCIRHYEAERQLAEDLLDDLEALNKRGRLPRNREAPLAPPKSKSRPR
ncbi:PadR family transcriptional regulator [Nocardia sp. 852002-20019_SCH5090214]|jgi:DNA-binding PadR family transcriptional regulator|uniref:PadR family transcriptional regulator n=1 Tax=Nocardia nova TaxID=37330 RepID=A0A2S5ZXQ3_9NOCA|nr:MULTISPECIES: PadR family transcriptional regulator [Nocardia]OBF75312.1 PadR family transcriptional regulator [Mycobacterium sp. 852002-51759_SCH5129042]MBF6146869.1 PadR family transcriptional regulator [Nocardia nova]MBF6273501.1 PadR family transcriptional regulator [Nocardia nova]MBV7704473.1 PadR family transcriptional regulator [Nocardia nova]MDN2502457.1 PadR family transcriptional regulator [Nocardia nova]